MMDTPPIQIHLKNETAVILNSGCFFRIRRYMMEINSFEEALIRINQLEKENADLKSKLAEYIDKKPAGRKAHDEKWKASYSDFVIKYENGMSIDAIIENGSISRSTAFRYKKYYDMVNKDM